MRKKFLGFVCFLYTSIILYVLISDKLKNYLAPQMQIYLKLSVIPLFIIGIVLWSIKNKKDKFKISDLILILPLIMLIVAGDGRLTVSFASNRINNYNKDRNVIKEDVTDDDIGIKQDNNNGVPLEEIKEEPDSNIKNDLYDFSDTYFDVVDSTYDSLANYITYVPGASIYEGKTIRVKGFVITKEDYIPDGYFALGKYSVSCCAADATFVGFIAKYDINKVKNNNWYEIEGVLVKDKDKLGSDILAIEVINIKEIDGSKEEQYVYPCYAYDNGMCSEVQKYDLKY